MEEILPHPQGHDVHILLRYRQFGIPECIIPEQELLQGSGFQIHTTKPCGNAPVQRLPVVFWTPSNRIPQHHPHPPLLRPLVCNILLFNEFFPPNFRNMKFMNLIHMILSGLFKIFWPAILCFIIFSILISRFFQVPPQVFIIRVIIKLPFPEHYPDPDQQVPDFGTKTNNLNTNSKE